MQQEDAFACNLPKSIRQSLAPLDGELESHIEPLVLAMRRLGFATVSSCQGHFRPDDFQITRPNVVFCAFDRGLLHGWVREVSISPTPLPVVFYMFPVWNPDRDVVHEDNWIVWIDVSHSATPKDAEDGTLETIAHLIKALERANINRPLATDYFVRSRW